MSQSNEWYYNTVTGKVELGPQSPMANRLGPYPTKEAAEKALETARERNKHWDEQNRSWSMWHDDAKE